MASTQLGTTTTSYDTITHGRNLVLASARLYAVWNDGTNLVYQYSDDSGATWSSKTTIPTIAGGGWMPTAFHDADNARLNFVYAGGNNPSASLRMRAITSNVTSGVPGALTTETVIDAAGTNLGVSRPYAHRTLTGTNPRYWIIAAKSTAAGIWETRAWYAPAGVSADTAGNWVTTNFTNLGGNSGYDGGNHLGAIAWWDIGAQNKLTFVFAQGDDNVAYETVTFDPEAATPTPGTVTSIPGSAAGSIPETLANGALMVFSGTSDYIVFGRYDAGANTWTFFKSVDGVTWTTPSGWSGLTMGRCAISTALGDDFILVHGTSYGGISTTGTPLLQRRITAATDSMGAPSAFSDTNANTVALPHATTATIYALYRGSTASPYTVRSDFVAAAATVSIGRPSADSVDGAWTDQAGGTSLFAVLDETSPSDADYIRSELTPSASGTRVKIGTITDPASSTGHVIRWRVARDVAGGNQIDMTVSLRQGGGAALGGGTLIAAFTRSNVTDTWTTYEETLSAAQADSITNYADLYFEFSATEGVPSTAFPTTNLIDSFTRANEDPIANGWSGPIITTDGRGKVLSNQLASAGGVARDYWTTSFGADQEVWMTVATLPGSTKSAGVKGRIVDPNVSTVDYYEFVYTVGTGWRMFRVVNAGYTQIGSTVTTPALAAGDGIGFELIGSTLRGMHRVSGTWAQIMSVSDSTITAGGYIGHELSDTTARADDFGGGDVS